MRPCAELLRCSLWEMCLPVKSVPGRLWLRSASIGFVQLPECRHQQDSGVSLSFGPMGQFPTRNFATEQFRTETENASLRATTNVFRRRFGVSVTLTPRYKCICEYELRHATFTEPLPEIQPVTCSCFNSTTRQFTVH